MAKKSLFLMILASIIPLVTACSSGGDWPNLSDRMPDPTERNKVIERTDVTTTPRPIDEQPQSPQSAATLLANVRSDLDTMSSAFETAMQAWRGSGEADSKDLWMGAQLAVTRLSQTSSRLDPIILSEVLKGSAVVAEAQTAKAQIDEIVAEARKELASRAP